MRNRRFVATAGTPVRFTATREAGCLTVIITPPVRCLFAVMAHARDSGRREYAYAVSGMLREREREESRGITLAVVRVTDLNVRNFSPKKKKEKRKKQIASLLDRT